MKVERLVGADLDYWVAMAEGLHPNLDGPMSDGRMVCRCILPRSAGFGVFAPSYDWAHGGPIIERENIQISNHATSPPGMTLRLWYAVLPVCQPKRCATRKGYGYMDGDTPLIAAMRCYVASVYGEEMPDAR